MKFKTFYRLFYYQLLKKKNLIQNMSQKMIKDIY